MEKVLEITAIKEKLVEFENAVVAAIEAELTRINRPVRTDEWDFIPFNGEVCDYVAAIRLDENGQAVLDTSFRDVSEKSLERFIADNEIDHWNIIALLELLLQTN
jgi:hypothetical protein